MFAIGSITEIALNLDDFLGDLERLVLGAVANHIGQARVGILFTVRHAQSAANSNVKPGQTIIFCDSYKAEVVGK
jgi:hypothetical protein